MINRKMESLNSLKRHLLPANKLAKIIMKRAKRRVRELNPPRNQRTE
jgi:hypothetical protein